MNILNEYYTDFKLNLPTQFLAGIMGVIFIWGFSYSQIMSFIATSNEEFIIEHLLFVIASFFLWLLITFLMSTFLIFNIRKILYFNRLLTINRSDLKKSFVDYKCDYILWGVLSAMGYLILGIMAGVYLFAIGMGREHIDPFLFLGIAPFVIFPLIIGAFLSLTRFILPSFFEIPLFMLGIALQLGFGFYLGIMLKYLDTAVYKHWKHKK